MHEEPGAKAEEPSAAAPAACDDEANENSVKVDIAGDGAAAASASACSAALRPSASERTALTAQTGPSPEVLLENAKKHMRKTACTVLNEETGQYEFQSVWKMTPKKMSFLGVGVRLYFDFVKFAGFVFLILSVLSVPSIYFNAMGSMIDDSSAVNGAISRLSVANLGNCPASGCRSFKELWDRCALAVDVPLLWKKDPAGGCDLKVMDVTQWLGLLDGVGVLIFMCFAVLFSHRWIPRVVRQTDKAHVTPADFTVWITGLPKYLPDELHADYETQLKDHLKGVLQKAAKDPITDDAAVQEVTLVREYDGAIMRFTQKGQILQDMDNSRALHDRALAKGKDKKVNKHLKQIETLDGRVSVIDKRLRDQATKVDEERGVCSAFVTFKHEEYKEKVLDEYRFARHALFRLCQPASLRFGGRRITVKQACEPNDLYWENLDFDTCQRTARKAVVVFLTFLVLILCSVAIASLKSSTPKTAAAVDRTTWVIENTASSGTDALGLCSWALYSSATCAHDAPNSNDWAAARLFNASGTVHAGPLQWGAACADAWQSGAGSAASPAWIGVEFNSTQSVKCMEVLQQNATFAGELRIYACPAAPAGAANLSAWRPAEHCQAMEVVYPSSGSTPSLIHPVPDASCATDPADYVPFEVAEAAKAAAAANPAGDATLGCFCKQQAKGNLAKFLAPPYVTPEEQLCKEWSQATARQYGQTVGSVLAVLVLNQVLLVLYSFFIAWERLCTVTDLTRSQLWKLFLSQFVNTGLLIALINANFQGTADSVPFLKVLSIGTGDYHDLNAQWFTAVGATLVITILLQVFSTTLPPLAMSYIVTPLLARVYSRTKVTQDALNAVYTLPSWNLSLRLAQTLNVIFCIMMYSGGMPVLYPIGCLYCLVAYWMDRWCLLKGSRRPPAYTEDIQQMSMHLLPWAAFLHVLVAGWTFGNQSLFPSRWSVLRPLAETIFGISEARYHEVMEAYRTDASHGVSLDFAAARFMDFSREGAWLVMLIFLACAAYYVVYYLWLLLLRPFVSPMVLLLAECMGQCCPKCCRKKHKDDDELSRPYAEAQKEMESKGFASSYRMSENTFYQSAYRALEHTHQQVKLSMQKAAEESAEGAEPPAEAADKEGKSPAQAPTILQA